MSGDGDYWCSNDTSPSPLQKPTYNLRSTKRKYIEASSSSTTNSRISNKRPRRRQVQYNRLRIEKKKRGQGIGRLFAQTDSDGRCSSYTLHSREYSAKNCSTPKGIDGIFPPPSAKNNDGSVTCCIDNTNLLSPLELYEQIGVVEKNVPGRKYNIAALSRDNGRTWRFVCILYLHPNQVLYSHCHYDVNQELVVEKEIHNVDMIAMHNKPPIECSINDSGTVSIRFNTFDIHYVNLITSESNADDGCIECNVNRGPDKVHSNDARPEHNTAVEKAIRGETKLVQQLKKKNNNFTNNKFTSNFYTSKRRDIKSLARKKRVTAYDNELDLGGVPTRGVAIPLPPSSDNYTTIEMCFVPTSNISKLSDISVNEEQQIERELFDNKVRELSTSIQTINVSSVPNQGLVLEGSTNDQLIGTTDKSMFSRLEPRERMGSIIAQWAKTDTQSVIDLPLLLWMYDFTFGSPSPSTCCKRRVTSNFGKRNTYFGRARSSQPSVRTRTGRRSVRWDAADNKSHATLTKCRI